MANRTGNSSRNSFARKGAFYITPISGNPLPTEPSYPAWTATIRQHYWHLRHARGFNSARIRKEYRRIEVEKKRLIATGTHPEAIRLLCRHLVNLNNKNAERRWIRWCEYGSSVIPVQSLTGWPRPANPRPARLPEGGIFGLLSKLFHLSPTVTIQKTPQTQAQHGLKRNFTQEAIQHAPTNFLAEFGGAA